MLERIDIIPDLIPKDQIFDDFKDCLKWITDNKTNKTTENK
jgi:SulP family sulfate permease